MELDKRKKQILRAVIEEYINTGEPVGSKAVLNASELSVSPATVRNDMSELERLGLLTKPHTSAGRVPSEDAYRYYVDSELGSYALTDIDIEYLMPKTNEGLYGTVRELTMKLADFSGCTVFAVSPSSVGGVYTFETVVTGKKTVAILAVSTHGGAKTVFSTVDSEITKEDAEALSRILNEELSGFPVERITEIRYTVIKQRLMKVAPKMVSTADAVKRLIEMLNSYELEISGSENLLAYPEFSDGHTAREYLSLLSKKDALAKTITESGSGNGVTVRIGAMSGINLPNSSVVSARCGEKIPVILSVIGPTRMNYAKLTAGLDFATKILESFIEEEF